MSDENERRLTASGMYSTKKIMVKNFFGGMAWGVGSVIGATVVIALMVFVLRTVSLTPVVGNFVSGVISVVDQNRLERLPNGNYK